MVGSQILPSLYRRLALYTGKGKRRIFVVTSPQIWSLWSKKFLASFPADAQPTVLFQPPGEPYKRFTQVERLITEMIGAGADRSSLLIAFGGGIVGDVGGFVAASLMRGIDYIQMPSTLLSQVDSSVGGKVGVNLAIGKNLAGAFHHPKAVFADIELLQTLPDRELRAGLFESVKAGIIRDAKLFRFMETNRDAILARDAKALEQVVAASIRMKAEVVGSDESESGQRPILNLGNTVGHAIEAVPHYRKLLHGDAVAWGMLAALEIGRARGTIIEAQARRIHDLILAYGPLPRLKLKVAAVVEATARDKKNRAGVRRFVLPSGIGDSVVVENVTDAELNATVTHMLALARQQA